MAIRPLILNKYLPIEELGSGGFATVILAKDMLVKRKVAIKCVELTELDALRATWVREDLAREATVEAINNLNSGKTLISLTSDEGEDELTGALEQRYLDELPGLGEAQALCMLSDPTIVTVYDCQISGNTVYLIEEYIEGSTLGKLLEDHNDEITLDIVAAVAKSVAHALEVAHSHGILHFDIKPDNVLIDKEGNVKVTDFGLATLSDAQGQGTANAGTIGYMPLEQMRGEVLDARADEWSLASIVYEMVVGANPFIAPTIEESEVIAEGADLTLPSRCWDNLSEDIDDVIFDALHPDREERYPTVAAFAADLLPCLGDPEQGRQDLLALVSGRPIEDDDELEGEGDSEDESSSKGFFGLFKRKKGREREDQSPVAIVPNDYNSDGIDDDFDGELHLYERVSPRMARVGSHLFGALGSAFFAGIAAMNIPLATGVDNPVFWGVVGVCAVLGLIRPGIGAAAAYVALAAALFFNQSIVLAIVVAVVAIAWAAVVAMGPGHKAIANSLLSFPLLGAFGMAPLSAMLAGYCATVPRTLATAAVGCLTFVVLAAFGSQDFLNWWVFGNAIMPAEPGSVQQAVLALITVPETWILVAAWVVAPLILSLCAKARRHIVSIIGVIAATAILAVGVVYVAPTLMHLFMLAASAVIMLLVVSFPSPRAARPKRAINPAAAAVEDGPAFEFVD